ncbi:MAG: hypothetical protein ABJA02_01365, partial [Acidobacteriota bacterium]
PPENDQELNEKFAAIKKCTTTKAESSERSPPNSSISNPRHNGCTVWDRPAAKPSVWSFGS